MLEEKSLITYNAQMNIFSNSDIPFFESGRDYIGIITKTAMSGKSINFYEYYEFMKLYKYSVPFFFEGDINKAFEELYTQQIISKFLYEQDMMLSFSLATSLKGAMPMYY